MKLSSAVNDIDNALRFIPADDRTVWLKIGMAIKSALGDNGYSLWDCWSQSACNYNERAAQQVWRSFKAGSIKIATLFHYAREYGYRPDKTTHARPIPEKKPPQPQQGNTGKYAAEIWLRADCTDKAVAAHPYAIAKGISWAAGSGRAVVTGKVIGKDADCIVVPVRNINTGKMVAVQCVNAASSKQTFGPVSGNALVLGNTLDKSLYWCVCEGWASAVSMVYHHLDGNGVAAAAFGKGNMDAVAHTLAGVYRPEKIRLLRECDK